MLASADNPTLVKVNSFNIVFLDYDNFGSYLVELFTWMKYFPSSAASWKRPAEERYKEYSYMFVGMLREVEDRIVMTFIRFSSASLTNHVETRGRTPQLREKRCHRLDEAEAAWTATAM